MISIKNDEIVIDSIAWNSIKSKHSKDKIIDDINTVIQSKNIIFPIKNHTLDEAIADFKTLQKEDCLPLIHEGKFTHRYEYNTPFSDYYISSSLSGLKSSNYFNFDARMECDSINSPSPVRTWNSVAFRKSLLGALFSLKLKEVNSKSFATCIAMRKYIASQFRPSAAKCIYQLFQAENVLDFSSGWGDRLSGFMATDTTKRYVGIDPSTKLFNGYSNQIKEYSKFTSKSISMINSTAEDAVIDEEFDLIFTSPPYFNIERYTQDKNQSFKMYKKLDIWLEKFLFFSISKYWNNLKEGGILAINIGDVYSNHTINKICDPMNNFIATLSKANYLGCMGYRMQKRIRSKSDKVGIFAEPIWIWGKGISKFSWRNK